MLTLVALAKVGDGGGFTERREGSYGIAAKVNLRLEIPRLFSGGICFPVGKPAYGVATFQAPARPLVENERPRSSGRHPAAKSLNFGIVVDFVTFVRQKEVSNLHVIQFEGHQ